MSGIQLPPLPPEAAADLAIREQAYAELADAIRPLLDASVRTRHDVETIRDVAQQARELSQRLLEVAQPRPLGLEVSADGRLRDHGNPIIGMRNPVAPPLQVQRHPRGRVASRFSLGAIYEGPPGCVHGGIIAAILDQLCGMVAADIGKPGMTAYLNLTYRRPTYLGALGAEAWVAEEQDWKTLVRAKMVDAEGTTTVEAEGLFVVPRWARDIIASHPVSDAGDFRPPTEA